jgi:hypothetical protein
VNLPMPLLCVHKLTTKARTSSTISPPMSAA